MNASHALPGQVPALPVDLAGDAGHCAAPEAFTPITALRSPAPAIEVEIWLLLLAAIAARLTHSVGVQAPGSHGLELPEGAGRIQVSVLECAEAVNQVHSALRIEVERRQQVELQLFDAQTHLAQLQAELAGRAGRPDARASP